jgi:hypothetical protein
MMLAKTPRVMNRQDAKSAKLRPDEMNRTLLALAALGVLAVQIMAPL